MNRKLSLYSRLTSIIVFAALMSTLFFPLWQIQLSAPQYPEGLVMKIYPDNIGGDVDVINGLNHYIGMRTLHAKDFIEFTILPWLIGTVAFFGLLSFLINRKWMFTAWTFFFILFAIVAMFDFWRWEYNYGHNLDPEAPIKVPGMSYQPPLLGYKKLLNFGAYSIPDVGGWIFILSGILLMTGVYLELKPLLKEGYFSHKPAVLTAICFIALNLSACNADPVPIVTGKHQCEFCKMGIADTHYSAEMISAKGKIFFFDDILCLNKYTGMIDKKEIGKIYYSDYAHPQQLIPQEKAILFNSELVHAPMGGKTIAFSNQKDLEAFKK